MHLYVIIKPSAFPWSSNLGYNNFINACLAGTNFVYRLRFGYTGQGQAEGSTLGHWVKEEGEEVVGNALVHVSLNSALVYTSLSIWSLKRRWKRWDGGSFLAASLRIIMAIMWLSRVKHYLTSSPSYSAESEATTSLRKRNNKEMAVMFQFWWNHFWINSAKTLPHMFRVYCGWGGGGQAGHIY